MPLSNANKTHGFLQVNATEPGTPIRAVLVDTAALTDTSGLHALVSSSSDSNHEYRTLLAKTETAR